MMVKSKKEAGRTNVSRLIVRRKQPASTTDDRGSVIFAADEYCLSFSGGYKQLN
jgi:hypothetical protein